MKLIRPSYDILECGYGLDDIKEHIEQVGRTCYKSEQNIKRDEEGHSLTAEGFVERMIKAEHYAMLEHGTVYLKFEGIVHTFAGGYQGGIKYFGNPYSKVNLDGTTQYVTSNMRVLQENDWLNDLKYLCEPTEFHEKRVTVRFTTDRGVSHKRFVA